MSYCFSLSMLLNAFVFTKAGSKNSVNLNLPHHRQVSTPQKEILSLADTFWPDCGICMCPEPVPSWGYSTESWKPRVQETGHFLLQDWRIELTGFFWRNSKLSFPL